MNLSLVIDNPRFLILLWIRVANLGFHILAIMRLPGASPERYDHAPMLVETFAQTPEPSAGFPDGRTSAAGTLRPPNETRIAREGQMAQASKCGK